MGLEKLLEETPEAYYWTGFLMADGYINHKNIHLKLTLSKKDENHLNKFSKFVNVNMIRGKSIIKNKKYTNFTVSKGNKNILIKFIKKFDFKNRKSYNPPKKLNIKNNDLFISFFIGYFDGDGTIGKYNNQISVLCHENWKSVLNVWFKRVWNLAECVIRNNIVKIPKAKLIKIRNSKLCRIGTKNSEFVWFLKNKAVDLQLPFLERKWKRIFKRNFTYKTNQKEIILKLIKNGFSNQEIKQKINCGNYIYDVRHKYC